MQQTLIDGRYSLIEALGSGGMAKVYLARDEVLGRGVALKVLREQYAEDERFIERFRREAQSAASLSHPNIVSVYDRGRAEDGAYYMIMEHVPGGALKDKIVTEGPLGPGEAARLAAEVAEALAAAHAEGVVHRDVKPQNVLLTNAGAAKVADFGIARAASATALSGTGMVLGTASYMSPEQAKGEPVGPASDLYSLGVVLYEMLVGIPPYEAESLIAVAMKHVTAPPPPPRRSNPDVPANLNAITTKLLRKHPDDRYASAADLAEDLRRARNGLPPLHATDPEEETRGLPVAQPVTVAKPPVSGAARVRRRRLPPTLAGPVALLALVGAVLWGLLGGYGEASGGLDATFEDIRQAFGLGGVEVPGVVGYDEATARERLDDAGLEAEVSLVESPEEDAGEVLSQSLPEGERSREGDTVTLEVGDGPSTVQVPDLAGMSLPEAEDALTETGLALGKQEEAPSATVLEGGVTEQDPSPGTEAEEGDTVNLTLSSGPAEQVAATPPVPAATTPQAEPSFEAAADDAETAPAPTEEAAAPTPQEAAPAASAPEARPAPAPAQPSVRSSQSGNSASDENRVVRKESAKDEREDSEDRKDSGKSGKSD